MKRQATVLGVIGVGGILTMGSYRAHFTGATADPVRLVISQTLPRLNGDHVQVKVVEVTYAPGESSPPHSHPCAVIGYVIEGSVRTQVKGDAELVVKAGQSFYEPPNGTHQVSANASKDQPARFTATFVCEADVPLSGPPNP